jgi:hypothetical protein
MWRNVLAVVLGYAVLAALTMAGVAFSTYAFRIPLITTQPVTLPLAYLLTTLVLGTLAAVAGGYLAARIARRRPPVAAYGLAALVLVLGTAYALTGADPVQPAWHLWSLPLTGVAGVVAGAQLCRTSGSGRRWGAGGA